MADNVIDLISSSPPRRCSPPKPQSAPSPTTLSPGVSSIAQVGIENYSDRLCNSRGQRRHSLTPVENRCAKQPRLSSEADVARIIHPLSADSTRQPSLFIQQRLPSALRDYDVEIESISSTEQVDPIDSSPRSRTDSLKESTTASVIPCSSLLPDFDPFASSPRILASTKTKESNHHVLSDPIASSSPVRAVSVDAATRCASTTYLARNPREAAPSRVMRTAAAWDPISSSAPCSSTPITTNAAPEARATRCPSVISIQDSSGASSDAEFPAFGNFDLSQPRPSQSHPASTCAPKIKPRAKPIRKTTEARQAQPRQKLDAAERAAVQSRKKEEKRQEREREKQERQRQKDVAAATVEVNKAKGNRKISAKEMIVDVSLSLCPTTKLQLQTLLDGLEVQHTEYQSAVDNVIQWRRKIKSRFDDESGQWVPVPLRIEKEQHVAIIVTAEEMVRLAVDDGLDEHVETLRRHFPSEKLIYMLQGMTVWMRKNRNLRNRQFAAEARSQRSDGGQAASGPGRGKEPTEHIDDEVVEDAMLRLQVEHDVLIHHTAIPLETAQWISIFTQNISTIPYRKQRDQDTAGARFCMESGQVKTGENARDTYVRMLQEVFRVTAPVAYGVAAEFGSVTRLVEGLEARGPSALEMVRKSANRDGAFSDRVIGQALSKRLYKVFTGTDETSTDI